MMDYHRYIRENFAQGAFLPDDRIHAFLRYAQISAEEERVRLAEAVQRQPWLAQWYQPRDDIKFQIDHMLRITGSQAISLTSEQGMFEKSRQMLLLEAPGAGSDDTTRGTLYEGWILTLADQMMNQGDKKITALPNIIQMLGQPKNGLTAAPDNLYWANDHFLIVDAKCPRVPHVTAPDAYVAQLHFYEAALRDLMRTQYPEWANAPVKKLLAQGDILSGRVTFLEIPTVPGMIEGLWRNAQTLNNHIMQTQQTWPMPSIPAFDMQKMPLVESLSKELLHIRDQHAMLEAKEIELKTQLESTLGNDPKAWPKLPKEIGGAMRPNWPRDANEKLLTMLRENDLPIPEKMVYDTDALVQVLENNGIQTREYVVNRIVDVATAIKALEIKGISRCDVQTPGVTLMDKRPKEALKPEQAQTVIPTSPRP